MSRIITVIIVIVIMIIIMITRITIIYIANPFILSFMALPSVQDRSEDGNESVSLEKSETYPSDKLVLMLVPETNLNLSPNTAPFDFQKA